VGLGSFGETAAALSYSNNPNTLVAVEGTDVFVMLSQGGTNDAIPTSIMQKLIARVQNLR
jgi:hypothetical protein